jgi:hypothetical protein
MGLKSGKTTYAQIFETLCRWVNTSVCIPPRGTFGNYIFLYSVILTHQGSWHQYPLVTLPSQWFLASTRHYAYQPLLHIAQILDVSSKEGAVIGAVLCTWKFHHWHRTHE